MAKQLWEREFDKLSRESLAAFESLDRWSPETAEELSDLLRALRRKKGFGLFFVQCSPALGERVIAAIRERFPQKRLERFELNQQSETLYFDLRETYQKEAFEVACVTGLEQVLYSYEDAKRLAGWSEEDIYSYSWKGVPPLLSHLNRQREIFEENLPIALIFLVPRFAIDYLVQRAPDFFDWRSGLFKFIESSESLQNASQELVSKRYQEYLALTPEQRMKRILEIKDKILQLDPSDYQLKSNLLREQGRLFDSDRDLSRALDCYNRAITVNPKNYKAWNSTGIVLNDLNRYEEAIESYDRALKIKPNHHQTWNDRGNTLRNLNRNEEAITSYDRALEIQPDYHYAWYNRGIALHNLQRYIEAIKSYDRALEIQPDYHYAWYGRGIALHSLQRYKEAIKSYDRALEIQPDYHYAWYNRGITLANLERYKEAIESYDRALAIQPNYYFAWVNRGYTAREAEFYEEALASFDKALELHPDSSRTWRSRAIFLEELGDYEEALSSYKKISEIESKSFWDCCLKAYGMYYLHHYEDAVASYNEAIELIEHKKYDWSWSTRYYVLKVEFKSNPSYFAFYGRSLSLFKLGR